MQHIMQRYASRCSSSCNDIGLVVKELIIIQRNKLQENGSKT